MATSKLRLVRGFQGLLGSKAKGEPQDWAKKSISTSPAFASEHFLCMTACLVLLNSGGPPKGLQITKGEASSPTASQNHQKIHQRPAENPSNKPEDQKPFVFQRWFLLILPKKRQCGARAEVSLAAASPCGCLLASLPLQRAAGECRQWKAGKEQEILLGHLGSKSTGRVENKGKSLHFV